MLLVAACGGPGPTADGLGISATRLVLAVPNTSEGDALRAAAAHYSEQTGIAMELVQAPYSNLFEKVGNACASRSATYDLILVDDPWFPFLVSRHCFLELTPFFAASGASGPSDDFLGKSLALCREPYAEGPYYCLPYVGNAQMFFFNQEVFAQHGQVGPPGTWEEALRVMRKITREGRGEMFGYVLRGQEGNPVVANFMPVFWSFGGRMFDPAGDPSLATPEGLAALEFFLELKEISPPGAESFNADELGTYLLQGSAAAAINWPNWIASFEDPDQSRVVGKMGYGPIPDGTQPGSSEIGHWLLAISAHSTRSEAAFEFLDWVTSAEQMRLAAERGSTPVRASVFTDPALTSQQQFRHFPTLMRVIESSTPRPRHPRWPEIENALGVELSKAVAGRSAPGEALERAEREIARIVGR